jgi:hypothetical protein
MSAGELRDVIAVAGAELDRRSRPPESPASRTTVEERPAGRGVYRLEMVKCGKHCRCERGELHGPYWYLYAWRAGRMVSRYIGRALPEAGPAGELPALEELEAAAGAKAAGS